jgi:hypothetical protein
MRTWSFSFRCEGVRDALKLTVNVPSNDRIEKRPECDNRRTGKSSLRGNEDFRVLQFSLAPRRPSPASVFSALRRDVRKRAVFSAFSLVAELFLPAFLVDFGLFCRLPEVEVWFFSGNPRFLGLNSSLLAVLLFPSFLPG